MKRNFIEDKYGFNIVILGFKVLQYNNKKDTRGAKEIPFSAAESWNAPKDNA